MTAGDADLPTSVTWRDSLSLLHRANRFIVDSTAYGSTFTGWHEYVASEGETELRQAAECGDVYAKEKLGVRLLDGDGMDPSPEEGLRWLEDAAESGATSAMERLAAYLFDAEVVGNHRLKAKRWLREAAARQAASAQIALATRLLRGSGLDQDPEKGYQALLELADRGHRLAHIKLAVHLLAGWGIQHDRELGLEWLRRIGAVQADRISSLALYLYMRALALPARERPVWAEEASVLFQEAILQGNRADELNLAYLLRRGELPANGQPSLDSLISPHLEDKAPSAVINQALRLAKGIQCEVNWVEADRWVATLNDTDAILPWWLARSEEGDGEGHLVVAWLCRHQLAVDPRQLSLMTRMNCARRGGWTVPSWMNHPVGEHNH